MNPVALPQDFGGIPLVDRLVHHRKIIDCVDIDINGNDVEFQFFALLEKRTVVEIQIFAILPAGLSAGIIFTETILTRAGDMLEHKDFRRRFEFSEFADQFFHICYRLLSNLGKSFI